MIVDVEASAFVLHSAITGYFYRHVYFYITVNYKCRLIHCSYFWSVKNFFWSAIAIYNILEKLINLHF